MTKNIHPLERKVRIIAGLVLMTMAFWGPSSYWFLLGIVPVLTGLLGWCPPYAILGINTCELKKKEN